MNFDLATIANNPIAFVWWFVATIGWVIPVFFVLFGGAMWWRLRLRNRFRQSRKFIVLAIDVPRVHIQTPKAVENIFNHLAGAQSSPGFIDRWWTGEMPNSFSFEIVSIGGYIQFLVHAEESYRDLIEAMIFAQYPDAEITEVEDYTKNWNVRFPHSQVNLWGTELKLGKKEFIPIRTWEEFVDESADEENYKDSMAGILEALGRIGPGEQAGIQIVVTPADNEWVDPAKEYIKKLSGTAAKPSRGVLGKFFGNFEFLLMTAIPPGEGAKEKPKENKKLTESETQQVKAIERKISKIGFYTKVRIVYIARTERFNKSMKEVLLGAFKQFDTLNLNAFKKEKRYNISGVVYFKQRRLNARRNRLLYQYKHRGLMLEPGTYGTVMNAEELATLWHFPSTSVKAPLVQRTDTKKSQPPASLPTEIFESVPTAASTPVGSSQTPPPSNLPTG